MSSNALSGASFQRSVALWLIVCSVLIGCMMAIGGITRLTESGLSITVWQPIRGILPPLNDQEWQNMFLAYQQSPEYIQKHFDFTLAEFKQIFWWEYIHRLWGRLLGVVFLVPAVFFWVKGVWKADPSMKRWVVGMFLFGGLQGFVGWWMVQSGLVDNPHVAHWRLMIHFLMALILLSLCLNKALQLYPVHRPPVRIVDGRFWVRITLVFLLMTMMMGSLMAGLDAGMVYNTFPTMNGYWLPPEWMDHTPWWSNLWDNPATVQWLHRWLAKASFVGIVIVVFHLWSNRKLRILALILLILGSAQIMLGIVTLLLQVPLWSASLHQVSGILLWSMMIVISRRVT